MDIVVPLILIAALLAIAYETARRRAVRDASPYAMRDPTPLAVRVTGGLLHLALAAGTVIWLVWAGKLLADSPAPVWGVLFVLCPLAVALLVYTWPLPPLICRPGGWLGWTRRAIAFAASMVVAGSTLLAAAPLALCDVECSDTWITKDTPQLLTEVAGGLWLAVLIEAAVAALIARSNHERA